MPDPILALDHLSVRFASPGGRGIIHAVEDVSLSLGRGEILGMVGESGCGKSTIGRTVVGLERPSSGSVQFLGRDLSTFTGNAGRHARRKIQYVFQDPYASLDAKRSVRQTLEETLAIAGIRSVAERSTTITKLIEDVQLSTEVLDRAPRELSGGQRQRVAIARALAVEPDVMICDEPVSALDVSIRAQVMNLFLDLRRSRGLSILLIAHDLPLVRQASDRIVVMHLGRIVEAGSSDRVYNAPAHPYTQALISAAPSRDPRHKRTRERIVLEGELPSPLNPPSGCSFRTRCWLATAACSGTVPALASIAGPEFVACLHAAQVTGDAETRLVQL